MPNKLSRSYNSADYIPTYDLPSIYDMYEYKIENYIKELNQAHSDLNFNDIYFLEEELNKMKIILRVNEHGIIERFYPEKY